MILLAAENTIKMHTRCADPRLRGFRDDHVGHDVQRGRWPIAALFRVYRVFEEGFEMRRASGSQRVSGERRIVAIVATSRLVISARADEVAGVR